MPLNCGIGEDSLRVPWTARRSNQSILKEISPEYSLEGLMLNLKLPNFGHLMQRDDSFEKTLMLGKIEGRRRRGWQRMRWLDGTADSTDMSLSKPRELVIGRLGVLQSMGLQGVGQHWMTELNTWKFCMSPEIRLMKILQKHISPSNWSSVSPLQSKPGSFYLDSCNALSTIPCFLFRSLPVSPQSMLTVLNPCHAGFISGAWIDLVYFTAYFSIQTVHTHSYLANSQLSHHFLSVAFSDDPPTPSTTHTQTMSVCDLDS